MTEVPRRVHALPAIVAALLMVVALVLEPLVKHEKRRLRLDRAGILQLLSNDEVARPSALIALRFNAGLGSALTLATAAATLHGEGDG